VLIPFSASYDNDKIVYVDAFPSERYVFSPTLWRNFDYFSPDSIFIRLVKEAQPDVRLNKLLDLNRFADALEFAKANNLQLEVHFQIYNLIIWIISSWFIRPLFATARNKCAIIPMGITQKKRSMR